jgi:hypothetical protein
MTRYGFHRACGAFFHAHAAALARLLPAGLRPLESHPELGVLALTVFDFAESEVGPYRELVGSVMVIPWAPRGEQLPDAAFFPVLLATTTDDSRTHAAARWKLPELEGCLAIEFDDVVEHMRVSVRDGEQPLLRLTVGLGPQAPSHRHYQCFSADAEQIYRVGIDIVGPLFEHEDERGALDLHDQHPLGAWLGDLIDDPIPFREQSVGRGEQQFASLRAHAVLRRRA